MRNSDIWTYIISLEDGIISEIKIITFSQGEIIIRDKLSIDEFVKNQRIIQ